ncbi:MAG: hypothetical protein WBN00_02170, partial [Sedimenticolaceae bacterium]
DVEASSEQEAVLTLLSPVRDEAMRRSGCLSGSPGFISEWQESGAEKGVANAAADDLSADFCPKPYHGRRPADGFRLIFRSGFQGRFSGIGWGAIQTFPPAAQFLNRKPARWC